MLMIVRIIFSFLFVAALLWFFARAGSGRLGALLGATGAKPDDHLELLGRRQLTRSSGVTLLRVGERHLLLGTSEDGVSVLAEGDDLAYRFEDDIDNESGDEVDIAEEISMAVVPLDLRGAVSNPVRSADSRPSRAQKKEQKKEQRRSEQGTVSAGAWTRSARPQGQDPARMNIFEALRELTVRR